MIQHKLKNFFIPLKLFYFNCCNILQREFVLMVLIIFCVLEHLQNVNNIIIC